MHNIGFGCVKLTSNFTEIQALRNLDTAYDHGIIHFDVARMYGFGLAEGILGKFAKNKRDKITITTKVGISPNNSLLNNLFLQNTIRHLYKAAKKLPVDKFNHHSADGLVIKDFKIQSVKRSLEKSLSELKTDYIDYLLLHEPTIKEANNDELINFLEIEKKRGTIRAYGLGSFAEKLGSNISTLNKKYLVLQIDNSFPISLPSAYSNIQMEKVFYFSPLRYLGEIKLLLINQPSLARSLSEKLGFDVINSLPDIFLMHQRFTNKSDSFLFTSSNNKHIKKIIERWSYVSELPMGKFENFNEVQKIIRNELFKTEK